MLEIGYALSSEEFPPTNLVRYAQRAEEAGFTFALISDHYHPWIDRQGQSPFVWSVIGAIAQVTQRLSLGTGVTCPTMRIHPAIVAQAAATAATMMPGRFFLGVGTGENLNEHILGDRWPPHDVRLEMLEEAVAIIRLLWQGGAKRTEDATMWWRTLASIPCRTISRRSWWRPVARKPPRRRGVSAMASLAPRPRRNFSSSSRLMMGSVSRVSASSPCVGAKTRRPRGARHTSVGPSWHSKAS
jgi:alkanesulfonate monooxygenase SsuD/methylene tetrahydromethanopterin reductase-like flavin-dependent oxidoreductase (luciferase family)